MTRQRLLCNVTLAVILPGWWGRAPGAAQWSSVQCPVADRDASERFERVERLDDFEAARLEWHVVPGDQNAQAKASLAVKEGRSGSTALRVEYEFRGKLPLEYVSLGRSFAIEKPGLGLGMYVKGAATRLRFRLRVVDRSGETHQADMAWWPGDGGWRFVAAAFDPAGGDADDIWGGDGNGRVDYPCRFDSLIADRPDVGYTGAGICWIDDLQLVRPLQEESEMQIEVLNKQLGNLYAPGEAVKLRVSGSEGTLRWRVTDFWNRTLAENTGEPNNMLIDFRFPLPGYYAFTLERRADGRIAESRVFRCGALPPPRPVASRNTFVGVCTHFRDDHPPYPLVCMELMARLGITEFRDEVRWDAVEARKGQMEIPVRCRRYLDRACELGMAPLIILDYGNPFHDDSGYPLSAAAIAGYADYSAFLARQLKGIVSAFEVWNEYCGGCGMHGKTGNQTPETYTRMLQAAHRALKQVVPQVTVVGLGGEDSGRQLPNIEGILKGGARFMDALSVHSYRYPNSPEETDLVGEIQRVAKLARQYDAPTRLWVTEIGWPTQLEPLGVGEQTQARYAVRSLALLQSTGAVEKAFWYDLKNDGLRRDYIEHNCGLVWHEDFNCAPKPAAIALAIFARATAGARPQRLWRQSDGYAVFYRQPDGSDLIVAWTTSAQRRAVVKGKGVGASDLMGNQLPARHSIRLGEDPVYIEGRHVQLAVARKAA
ncbi:MAG: hypothetical protein HY318_09220 [Armatimonadetes bacterium]|nr:hypothetical protein [Armatimonadota bacterium]